MNKKLTLISLVSLLIGLGACGTTNAADAEKSTPTPDQHEVIFQGTVYKRLNDADLVKTFTDTYVKGLGDFWADGTYYLMGEITPKRGKYWVADDKVCSQIDGRQDVFCFLAFVNQNHEYVRAHYIGEKLSPPYPIIINKRPE